MSSILDHINSTTIFIWVTLTGVATASSLYFSEQFIEKIETAPRPHVIAIEYAPEGLPKVEEFVYTEAEWQPEILIDESILAELPINDAPIVKVTPTTRTESVLSRPSSIKNAIKIVWPKALPASVNLWVPFYPQAPDGNRSLPRKEACEESSLIQSRYFLHGNELPKETFKQHILALVEQQKIDFNDYIDTSVAQTKLMYEKYFDGGEAIILEKPTIEQLKQYLASGYPIVAPFAGKKLGNTHYTSGGPRYHMLVVRGYDEHYFYTNDVGTRYGESFPYRHEVLMDALHDLIPRGEGNITQWKKRVLVIVM